MDHHHYDFFHSSNLIHHDDNYYKEQDEQYRHERELHRQQQTIIAEQVTSANNLNGGKRFHHSSNDSIASSSSGETVTDDDDESINTETDMNSEEECYKWEDSDLSSIDYDTSSDGDGDDDDDNDGSDNDDEKTISTRTSDFQVKDDNKDSSACTNNNNNNVDITITKTSIFNNETKWDEYYNKLYEYRIRYGTCDITTGNNLQDALLLKEFIEYNRILRKNNLLYVDYVNKLESIPGFSWGYNNNKTYWQIQYETYIQYKQKYGYTSTVTKDNVEYKELYRWIKNQQYRFRHNILYPMERVKLECIELHDQNNNDNNDNNNNNSHHQYYKFDWGLPYDEWSQMYQRLKIYYRIHGTYHIYNDSQLANWCQLQRQRKRLCTMKPEQEQLLNNIQFPFHTKRGRPMKPIKYPNMSIEEGDDDYITPNNENNNNDDEYDYDNHNNNNNNDNTNNNNNNSNSNNDNNKILTYKDIAMQKYYPNRPRAKPRHKIPWDVLYERLKMYREQKGTCYVSRKDDKILSTWIDTQRAAYKSNTITDERREKLEAINFVWDTVAVRDQHWNDMFNRLKEYKKQNGDCAVPRNYLQDPDLSMWCDRNRQSCTRSDRIEKLDAIGFVWATQRPKTPILQEQKWEEMFDTLKEYKRVHGNCNVPKNFKNYPKLGAWVDKQRQYMRHGTLDETKKARLDALGFIWDIVSIQREELWNQMYERLKEYKEMHGNCNVPRHYKEDVLLGGWVGRNRHLGRTGRMSNERRMKLDMIGFDWGRHLDKNRWDRQYQKLLQYKKKYGHVRVPMKWNIDPSFSNWVKYQRQRDKFGQMKDSEREQLDSVGFLWCRGEPKKRNKNNNNNNGINKRQMNEDEDNNENNNNDDEIMPEATLDDNDLLDNNNNHSAVPPKPASTVVPAPPPRPTIEEAAAVWGPDVAAAVWGLEKLSSSSSETKPLHNNNDEGKENNNISTIHESTTTTTTTIKRITTKASSSKTTTTTAVGSSNTNKNEEKSTTNNKNNKMNIDNEPPLEKLPDLENLIEREEAEVAAAASVANMHTSSLSGKDAGKTVKVARKLLTRTAEDNYSEEKKTDDSDLEHLFIQGEVGLV